MTVAVATVRGCQRLAKYAIEENLDQVGVSEPQLDMPELNDVFSAPESADSICSLGLHLQPLVLTFEE